MKKSFFCLLLLLVNFSYSAWGDVSDRMKARLSDVVAAKDAGTVGEGVDGYLHLRSSSNSTAQKLVAAENADRKELFQKLSAKTGGDVSFLSRFVRSLPAVQLRTCPLNLRSSPIVMDLSMGLSKK
ncbi:MAG: DUF1318 domain-containing protein [Opitutae bacterium]|nr:DUF1318 domain-containing protein [Opitutae bacterium]